MKQKFVIIILLGIILALTFVAATYYPSGLGSLESFPANINLESPYNVTATYLFGNLHWTNLTNYPVACPTGAITALNDSVTCSDTIVFGGNVTAENVHLPTMIFSHTDNNISVDSGGVWYNITFDTSVDSVSKRINHTYDDATNDTFTVVDSGIYAIVYTMSFQDTTASPDGHINTRVVVNNVEINGSLLESDTSKQNADTLISHSNILVELTAADEVKFQFTADDTTINLYSHATSGVHRDSAVITIKRKA